jgi:hypothetical protein
VYREGNEFQICLCRERERKMEKRYDKIKLIFCKRNEEGEIICLDPPYGYHIIYGIYKDSSYWKIGMLDASLPEELVIGVAEKIADSFGISLEII